MKPLRKKIWQVTLAKLSKHGLFTVFRHTWSLLAIFLVCLAIFFTMFRALTPWVKQYRDQIQQQLSVWVGQNITIHDVETTWYWFTPVLKFNQMAISDEHNHVLRFNQVMVGIDLFSSLLHWHVQPGVIYVDDAHFKIQQLEDTWQIEGFDLPAHLQTAAQQSGLLPFLGLLIAQDKLIIKHISADILLRDGKHIPLQSLHIKADHHAQDYRMYAKAIVTGKPDIHMSMIANMTMDSNAFDTVSGQVYWSVNRTNLPWIQGYFPQMPMQIKRGTGGIDAWAKVVHGRLKTVQAQVALYDLTLLEPGRAKPRTIPTLSANMAWQRASQGWRLTADQIFFSMDGVNWPENTGMLEYSKPMTEFHSYVKTLPLKQLLQTDFSWPKSMQSILALHPQGDLHDTELSWQNGKVQNVLTRFSHLSWRAKDSIPGLTGLSGAVYWQPTEGHLEIDGAHTVMNLRKSLAPITFETFNMSLNWQSLSHGLRLSLDRLVLSHPNLVLSATGALDDPLGPAANLRLQMDFSAKEAQFWLPYIPSKGLKPKLDLWLKQDIPRIAHASGRMRISGPLADFPFEDNLKGEFSIQSHVNGADILITPDWPMNADIDADIIVQGRVLQADVAHAHLADTTLHQVRITVPGIGTGKEVFLLHGKVKAPGEQIKSYIFATPLNKRFARWQAVTVQDPLSLDLSLEVPLYPESDHVYAKGTLDFEQNAVTVKVVDNAAAFSGLTGRLYFNEYGMTNGGLDGVLDGHPFSMRVQPLAEPQAGTEMRFEGEMEMGYLQYLVNHPMFSLMKGRTNVTALWTVYPDNAEIDKLYLNSSLVGMALHLPKPFGKSASEIVPLTVNIDFAPKQRMYFQVHYGKQISGLFTLQKSAQQDWLATGDVHLGEGNLLKSNAPGLRVSGSLLNVDMNAWQRVWEKWPQASNSPSLLTSLSDVDLMMDNMAFSGSNYAKVVLHAHQKSAQEWAFDVQQKNLAGDFTYNWSKHTLSAHIAHLNIAALKSHSDKKWTPKMASIPNLDVTVDHINYHDVDVGKIKLNSSTKPGLWTLNTCSIQTPEYQLNLQGDWFEEDHKSTSSIEAQLHISSLIKSFERWHLTPAVDAHFGQMTLSGKWPGAFSDLSFQKLSGNMVLVLKNGYISHLDRETEQKLGLGKLLSILSLQTIPRRLKLDFSDLVQQGYTFDVFKGNFKIRHGVMSTSDSIIDGPVAFGRMTGDLDLVNKLYDLDLRIYPYITASLPMVVTLAGGGPIAGIATWAISSLASKGMQKISGYTYKISGPWLNPVVQQVSIDKSVH